MKGVGTKRGLPPKEREELLKALKARFEKHRNRHKDLEWSEVQAKLEGQAEKLWSLNEMEKTGGEPDVVGLDKKTGEYIFFDCSPESPKGRAAVCYDREGLESRKEHRPKNTAIDMATAMGVELLTEEQYHQLQKLGEFDTKTTTWVKTPLIFGNSAALSLGIAASAVSSFITTVRSLTIAPEVSGPGSGSRIGH